MTKKRRPGRKRRIAGCVVLVLLVAGALWYTYFRLSVSQRLSDQLAWLESQGYPVTLEQLNAGYKLPAGAENAADYYVEAFKWYVAWDRDVAKSLPFEGSVTLPEPNAPLDPNTLALTQTFLADNAETIKWLDQGAPLESARYPVDFREGMMVQLPWLSDVRKCVRLYAMKMLLAIEQDQADEFVKAFTDGMALADSLKNMPNLVSQLVRIASQGLLTSTVMERGLGRLELTDVQLIQLSNRIEQTNDIRYLIQASAGEVCVTHDAMLHPMMSMQENMGGGTSLPNLLFTPYRILGLAQRDMCEYLELAQIGLNPEIATIQDLMKAAQCEETRREAIGKSHIMVHIMAPAMARISQLYGRHDAGMRSTQTALALTRYHLKSQDFPDSLTVLVPEYLTHVPEDPFDGKPIRYVKHAQGFKVYSVGQDGQDNGGASRDPKDREKPYDLVFSIP